MLLRVSSVMKPTALPTVPVRSSRQLGQALARMRRLRGSTQTEVAVGAGLRQPTVSSVESGAPGTELGTVFAMLATLGLELVLRERQPRAAAPTLSDDG